MQKHSYALSVLFSLLVIWSCSNVKKAAAPATTNDTFTAHIDLVNVPDDKVTVTVNVPRISTATTVYQFAKIIPGTYAIADYGRYVESFKAMDKDGNALPVKKLDNNSWEISTSDKLTTISYQVNDTYDNETGNAFEEGSTTIFSPAGTNILKDKNFMLNLCGFIGYFSGKKDIPYHLHITHPTGLTGSTSLDDTDPAPDKDKFTLTRFAEVVDHPIMYAAPDISTGKIGDMEVILSVYSPHNKAITSKAFFPELEKMMRAQKNYLGNINHTKKYAVLVYITSANKDDAKGIGALEHNTSTTAVFLESMKVSELIHVISHEFFHTLTPLNVHSKEIHDFDFNNPAMSQHLWMYEGFTEYFANHFQVHEGLISEDDFLAKMATKITNSRGQFKDDLSFTEMSKQVLDPKMKAQYPNVYEKGALMAMCLDILLRASSGGKTGVLYLMGELSKKYGPYKPFNDPDLIPEITAMTNKEVGEFLNNHVVKGVPINYDTYFAKVGITPATIKAPTIVPIMGPDGRPNIMVDTVQKKAVVIDKTGQNNFFKALGVQDGDELLVFNGKRLDASNITSIIMAVYGIEENEPVTIQVKRDGQVIDLKGNAKLNYRDAPGYKFTNSAAVALKNAWLKG